MDHLHVLVAGGGIGGLTAALCLAQRGHRVSLFEQNATFGESGAGIQLSPNCTRVLHALGLEQVLRASACLPRSSQFRDWKSGRVIAETALGDAVVARHGAPYYHMHRGDLLQVLVTAARQAANITLHPGSAAKNFEQTDRQVILTTSDARHVGDVLVGADGIHSPVRTILWGAEAPRFTGNVAWRALVPAERLPAGLVEPLSTVWWGPGKHFVHYYVRGGQLVNCVCVVQQDGWQTESWTERGEHAELQAEFAGWHPSLRLLIDHAEHDSLYRWALHDRAPMIRWGHGRVTLLGDACHATLPFMAQGAAMAIEDAAVLAATLSTDDNVAASLQRYEHLRRQRTASVQRGSRRNARVFHLRGLPAALRNLAAGIAGQHTMDQLFRYDALEAANRS